MNCETKTDFICFTRTYIRAFKRYRTQLNHLLHIIIIIFARKSFRCFLLLIQYPLCCSSNINSRIFVSHMYTYTNWTMLRLSSLKPLASGQISNVYFSNTLYEVEESKKRFRTVIIIILSLYQRSIYAKTGHILSLEFI